MLFSARHSRVFVVVSEYSPDSVSVIRGDVEPVFHIYEVVSLIFVVSPNVFPEHIDVSVVAPVLNLVERG